MEYTQFVLWTIHLIQQIMESATMQSHLSVQLLTQCNTLIPLIIQQRAIGLGSINRLIDLNLFFFEMPIVDSKTFESYIQQFPDGNISLAVKETQAYICNTRR